MAERGADQGHCALDQSCMLDDVRLTETIGSGSYAKVYRGEWKGIQVAVKQLHGILLDAGPLQRQGLTATFYKELGMNMKLRHPNIIQFLGVTFPQRDAPPPGDDCGAGTGARDRESGEDFPMMVMELMHCTLDEKLGDYRGMDARMPLSETVDTALDIAAALVYLHGKDPSIAHRDLAPKNVLLSSSGTAKICDLGVAKWVNSSSVKNTPGPGTLPYMPPEVRMGGQYSPVEVDLYSFGVTLLEMCSGLEPKPKDFAFPTNGGSGYQLVPEKTRREKSFAALRPPNHPLLATIEQCLHTKPSRRPVAARLLLTLQEMRSSVDYHESQTTTTANKSCSLCEEKDEEIAFLREQLEQQDRELSSLFRAKKELEHFRDQQLNLLKFKLQMTAKEGEKYQRQIQELHKELDEQAQMNLRLEVTNDRTNDINQLLKQKVEMDSHLCYSVPHTTRYHAREKRASIKEKSPKPVPKPRKKPITPSKSIDNLDPELYTKTMARSLHRSPAVSTSMVALPVTRAWSMDYHRTPTYLQLDAEAMLNGHRKENSTSVENLCSATKKQTNFTSYENPEDPVYITIPVTEPPTPPPRDQEFKFSRDPTPMGQEFKISHGPQRASSLHTPHSRPNRLSVIDETDESVKSPGVPSPRNQRTTQSMRGLRKVESEMTLEPPRPSFNRQSSRGDVLIYAVLTSIKGKSQSELSAKKGELVKVTNKGLEKKLCVAVRTNGESGTIKKKHLERITPVDIPYDFTNPTVSNRKGIFSYIAQCSSHNNTWVSPVESNRLTIVPSSVHSGDVGLLVKMTDYLLCCTDDEPESHFEIDLREQRLLKLSGYVLQCHPEGRNGAPTHWKLDGSANGHSWSHLSEQSDGDFFTRKSAHFSSVTNPMPCRYFRLTQVGRNSERNFRFCLSAIELYGYLYSSVVEERCTRRVY